MKNKTVHLHTAARGLPGGQQKTPAGLQSFWRGIIF